MYCSHGDHFDDVASLLLTRLLTRAPGLSAIEEIELKEENEEN